jgi:hypothetical protein
MEVKKLIAGPGIYICDECVQLCAEIMADELGSIQISFRVEADKIFVVGVGKEFEAPMTTTDPEVWTRFCQYVKELDQAARETSEVRRLKADLADAEKKEKEAAAAVKALQEKIAKAREERLAVKCEVKTVESDNLPAKAPDNLPAKV